MLLLWPRNAVGLVRLHSHNQRVGFGKYSELCFYAGLRGLDRQLIGTAPPTSAPPSPEPDRTARTRQAIAAAVTRSKREIPHFYLSTTVDLHHALAWVTAQNETRPVADRLLPAVLFIKAVALALRDVPELNARWEGDRLVRSDAAHVGVAVFLRDGGLVARRSTASSSNRSTS